MNGSWWQTRSILSDNVVKSTGDIFEMSGRVNVH
jgi:hypothetical protein